AFFVNIGLNLVLIPRFGEDGAAIATAIAYVVAMAVAVVLYRVTYSSLKQPRSTELV
ncbi:MAG: hypothetical protein GEU79_18315, partial [Acidimicrobiia bacterium]|nr:hypothetical protein [Acidimicrobiia bacterium]